MSPNEIVEEFHKEIRQAIQNAEEDEHKERLKFLDAAFSDLKYRIWKAGNK